MELPVFSELNTIERELPFTLHGAAISYIQNKVYRPFGFPVYQIITTNVGSKPGKVELRNISYILEEGQALILFPEEPHSYSPQDSEWNVDWISFQGFQLADLLWKMRIQESGIYTVSDPKILHARILEATRLLQNPTLKNKFSGSALVYSLLLEGYFQFHLRQEESSLQEPAILEPALTMIKNEYHKTLSLEDLSVACGLSVQHFIRLFKTAFTLRPTEYINLLRIEKSKELLSRFSDIKISDISRLCGFNNESYFCMVFKKYEHLTPREYRMQATDNSSALGSKPEPKA